MSLKDLPLKTTYCSTQVNLYETLTIPLLSNSTRYDRAVGFFSSTWLKEVADGLSRFVVNEGKARIVTSVRLSQHDWNAIREGDEGKSIQKVLTAKVDEALNELKEQFENRTLGALSWLIANDILEFRFSLPIGRLGGGILHSKLSLFYDSQNNGVAVFGSQNDSTQAGINEETLSVFTNWGTGETYFQDYEKSFQEKWRGNDTTIRSFPIPEAARHNIIEFGQPYQGLYRFEIEEAEEQVQQSTDNRKLRPYQEDAIQGWIDNEYQGLFEMATGSGKTFTAISGAKQLLEQEGRLAVIVLAPFTHLVEQWCVELEQCGFSPIACHGSRNSWFPSANSLLLEYRAKVKNTMCLVATHSSASKDSFEDFVNRIPKPWLLIADEVHGLGSENQRQALTESADYRIGLSATASRWFDEEGTSFIRDYFKKTVIEYGLKEAIEAEALTKYSYYPICVEFTQDELDDYSELTHQIAKLLRHKNIDDEQLQHLFRKRARLMGSAEQKIEQLVELVQQHQIQAKVSGEPYLHNLFYCSPGEHELVVQRLHQIGLKVHKFVYDVPLKERGMILKAFEAGDLEGIVAIKCLDEGVDVPATKRAYILASTSNPREFIQRRGRILRRHAGKYTADLYDFVVGPWGHMNQYEDDIAKSLLRRELPRVVEFNSLSETKHTATREVYEVCNHYGMGDLLYLEPWELYKRINNQEIDLSRSGV